MSFFRRVMAVLAIALITSLSAGALWSIEIDCIQGRPWDSGAVEVNGDPMETPTFEKDLNYRASSPGIDASNRERRDMFLDQLLTYLSSFLNP